jgi:phage antirepressor YoqD-like protein
MKLPPTKKLVKDFCKVYNYDIEKVAKYYNVTPNEIINWFTENNVYMRSNNLKRKLDAD